jgi:hypothetical protein
MRIAGTVLSINEFVILNGGRPFLVWQWYRIGGMNTNSRLGEKLLEIRALATGGERAAAIVAVIAELSENADETTALLHSFLEQSLDGSGALFQVEPSSAPAAAGKLQPALGPS